MTPTKKTTTSTSAEVPGSKFSSEVVLDWLDRNVRRRLSSMNIYGGIAAGGNGAVRAHEEESITELAYLLRKPGVGWVVSQLLATLNSILSAPFVFLSKGLDPVSLHAAVEYICANESTNVITVLHFVDDTRVVEKHHQLMLALREDILRGAVSPKQAQIYQRAALFRLITMPTNNHGWQWSAPSPTNPPNNNNNSGTQATNLEFTLSSAAAALSMDTLQMLDVIAVMDTLYT